MSQHKNQLKQIKLIYNYKKKWFKLNKNNKNKND